MSVALTFDDGYLDHVKLARLLAELKIRATFFVITHIKEFKGIPLLTQNARLIAEIADFGHEIGSHTYTHRVLTMLDIVSLKTELEKSKRFLEDITGREVLGLAYPYGIYNMKIVKFVRENYCYARATDILPWDDPLNMSTYSRYIIGSAGVRKIHKVLISLINPLLKSKIRPSIFMHEAKLSKLIPLIMTLKALDVKFVTMRELVELIEKKVT